MICVMLVSATLVYTTESLGDDSQFDNIFVAIYWAGVTMSTLGYGDFYPEHPLGMIVALATVFIGLIVITFAINIIGESFDISYSRFMEKENERYKERLKQELKSVGSDTLYKLEKAEFELMNTGATSRPVMGKDIRKAGLRGANVQAPPNIQRAHTV